MQVKLDAIPVIFGCMSAVLLLSASCVKDKNGGSDAGETHITLLVSAASRSINTDQVLWEDRVDELRMLVFDPGDGSVVVNQLLYFPDGYDSESRAVRIEPGTYDFYFIANETAYSGDFVTALIEMTNVSDFSTDTRFIHLTYRPDFVPDGTTLQGRFLMSAIYEGIVVSGGGTESNPLPLNLPTSTVELVRSLAKVDVVFRKRISGSDITNTVTSVSMKNVAATFSVPPSDSYYAGAAVSSDPAVISGFDYERDSIGMVTFYIPEFLVVPGGSTFPQLEINNNLFPIENDSGFGGLTEQRRTVPTLSPNSVIRNYHYIVNAYINAEGGVQIKVFVEPWSKETYLYLFYGDNSIVIPPVIPTECGNVEILSENEYLQQGLMGALNYQIVYWDPETQGPAITGGDPPYYCEKNTGKAGG